MMRFPIWLVALPGLLLASGCASPEVVPSVASEPAPPPVAASEPVRPAPAEPTPRWKAVLVAGDASLPVFDNATRNVARLLSAEGAVAPGGITRLSAARGADRRRAATLDRVLQSIGSLHPRQGEGCLVFLTSHGDRRRGLILARRDEALTPAALDEALSTGCGDAPTVAIVSGCYTGGFTRPPMARPNRIVLSAARADRPSFGCGAGRRFTVYDECLLAALGEPQAWDAVYRAVRACVAEVEREEGFAPSEPQAWFGREATGLALAANAAPGGSGAVTAPPDRRQPR